MSEIDIDELLKILPKLIRENDTIKGAILSALSGIVATHEDIQELITQMDKRFEAQDRHFEAIDRRFEAQDRRFEAIDRRFEAIDRHFEIIEQQNRENNSLLRNLDAQLGRSFEQIGRNVVARILEGEGIVVHLEQEKLYHSEGNFFPPSLRNRA